MSTIAEVLKIVQLVLQPWAAQNNAGTAVIASSLEDMWAQAFTTTDRPIVVIAFGGDDARGPFETAGATHRGDYTIKVALVRGRSITADRGQGLVETVGNADAYYNQLEACRDAVRSITNISQEQYVDYKSAEPMNDRVDLNGKRIDGWLITFSVAQDYPQLSDVPSNQTISFTPP